ncbi:MAG TPA: phosphatase PAP2 family protein [Gemmatimonadales bacterium]|nr:phosphatase PAP2 family protein [Gemmatimonadales bacterium]
MSKHPASTHTALAAAVAFTLVSLLVQLKITQPYDDAGLRAVAAMRTPGLTSFMLVFTTIGGGLILFPFALAFGAWLRSWRNGRIAAFYIVTCLTGWGVHALFKLLFGRARPTVVPRLHLSGWVSFPSGHAMMSTVVFGLAVVLATERKRDSLSSRIMITAGGALIAGIAASRVYLGVHYPSDVIAGMLGGWAWIGWALAILRPRMAPAGRV